MNVQSLNKDDTHKRGKVSFQCGPFNVGINTSIHSLFDDFFELYSEFRLIDNQAILDFELNINQSSNYLRRWFRPQCFFSLGGESPFAPMEEHQAFGMFEWGFNWSISSYCNEYLIIHAAVIEKNGVCVILPAPPGSGKSTLTALLTYSGWRLLSDELALICPKSLEIQPLARPINLKNRSIDVIKSEFPNINHSSIMHNTHKGTVCLFKAPDDSVRQVNVKAKATYVIFPTYSSKSKFSLKPILPQNTLFSLIENAFNYNTLGKTGFETMVNLVKDVKSFDLTYGDNTQVLEWFDCLSNE